MKIVDEKTNASQIILSSLNLKLTYHPKKLLWMISYISEIIQSLIRLHVIITIFQVIVFIRIHGNEY